MNVKCVVRKSFRGTNQSNWIKKYKQLSILVAVFFGAICFASSLTIMVKYSLYFHVLLSNDIKRTPLLFGLFLFILDAFFKNNSLYLREL